MKRDRSWWRKFSFEEKVFIIHYEKKYCLSDNLYLYSTCFMCNNIIASYGSNVCTKCFEKYSRLMKK